MPKPAFAPNSPPREAHSVVFDRVGFRYGRNDEVLSDVSFTMAQGSLNFVTGISGAGKSSLLKLIYLSSRPSRGLITLFGQDVSQILPTQIPFLKRRIGLVLQDVRLLDHLSVFENTALPLRIAGQKRGDYIDDIASLLDWVGLGTRRHALPPTLSAGEKQRAAIARAVIARPDILIADEPTGNVDEDMAKRLIKLLRELNRRGTTVITATHETALIPNDAYVYRVENAHVRRLSGPPHAQ